MGRRDRQRQRGIPLRRSGLLNDAGQANGIFQTWVNGALEAGRTEIDWLGAYNAYGINAVFVANEWNTGSPLTQERYFDDFVVGTQRIGC